MEHHTNHLLSRTCLAVAFAAVALAPLGRAQTQKTPESELYAVIAVEEQQGDLARAEALYRLALSDGKLSTAARQLARQRLERLLQRLGRDTTTLRQENESVVSAVLDPKARQEAAAKTRALIDARTGLRQGDGLRVEGEQVAAGDPYEDLATALQDPARLAELRHKAGELLDLRSDQRLEDVELRGLEWLGEPVVPEILARLPNRQGVFAQQLVQLLWRIGGEQAAEYLRKLANDPATPTWIVDQAWTLRRPEMTAVAEAFLAHPNFQVVTTLLTSGPTVQEALWGRVSVDALLSMAERGDAERRAFMIPRLASRIMTPADATRAVALLKQALAATDPTLGALAQQQLGQPFLHQCVAGIELVAAQPDLHLSARPQSALWPLDAYDAEGQLRPDVAARLWPQLLACAQRHPPQSLPAEWACRWLTLLAGEAGIGKVAELLPLIRSGHSLWGAVAARLQRDDIAPMLETIRNLPEADRGMPADVLRKLVTTGIPPEATIHVLALAPSPKQTVVWFQGSNQSRATYWMLLLASTGHPAAWSILLATHEFCEDHKIPFGAPVIALLRMAPTQSSAEQRETLRKLVNRPGHARTPILLTLLMLGDQPTLALLDGRESAEPHPLAPAEDQSKHTPLGYLFSASAKPPAHAFSTAQLTVLLERLGNDHAGFGLSQLTPHLADDIRDEHVRLLAAQVLRSYSMNSSKTLTWCDVALERARSQNGQNGWAEWLESALEVPAQRYHLLDAMTKEELQTRLPALRRWAAGGNHAGAALDALLRAGEPVDVAAAIGSEDPTVRRWAFQRVVQGKAEVPPAAMVPFLDKQSSNWTRLEAAKYFGKNLATEAVPGLIALLRDEAPTVREAAEQALTRIRFYHEQQYHWDRVLRGLDASPASAMEKLLLQARPDAPKAQRLLAIPSLGSLGKAEALPFLIDWSNETDAEIATAAKAAITRIHLEPRR
jgi:hypothetical protein